MRVSPLRAMIAIGSILVSLTNALRAQTTYRPTPQLTDLMGLRFFPQSGLFQFDGVQLVFPTEATTGYSLVLRQAGGGVVYQTGLRFEPLSGFPAFAWLSPLERGSDKFRLSGGGRYELAVRFGDQDLTVVPFEAKAIDSGDPFKPEKTFRLSGLWDKYAYVYAKDGTPGAQLYAVGWVIEDELGPTRADRMLTAQISQGGTVLCKSEVFVDARHWARYRVALAKPATNAPCSLADIQKADGAYRLEFRTKTKLLRSFAFAVAGQQIQRIPRNSLAYLASKSDGIPPKLVNTDLEMQEMFWFEASR